MAVGRCKKNNRKWWDLSLPCSSTDLISNLLRLKMVFFPTWTQLCAPASRLYLIHACHRPTALTKVLNLTGLFLNWSDLQKPAQLDGRSDAHPQQIRGFRYTSDLPPHILTYSPRMTSTERNNSSPCHSTLAFIGLRSVEHDDDTVNTVWLACCQHSVPTCEPTLC